MKKLIGIYLLCMLFSPLPAQTMGDQIDETLASYTEAGEIAGLVAIVATGDEIVHIHHSGYQEIEKGKK